PRLMACARSLVPNALIDRLDPFEASIRRFVDDVAARTRSGARVLDAGAGECRFRPNFAHASYVGIDFAPGQAAWDYSKLDVVGSIEELPFRNESFDRVLSIVVLEHTSRPARVIEELQRVLRPGGTVHMVLPHMWEEHQRPHDYFRFTSNGARL